METKYKTHHIIKVVLLFVCLAYLPAENSWADEDSRYLKAVREFADNVLKYGRDTYGPKHTPLFVDGLNIHTHEPVKWIAPNGDRWILSNLANQQNLLRTLDGLTRIMGDPEYKQAAMDAIKYAFENLRSPSGLLHWGGHQAYDVGADNPCGRWIHENKGFYPHYQLMWEVNPTATRQFIESFWSGHIRDWSNLDMNRHCHEMNKSLEEAWKHEYKGGPVFFEPKQGIPASFITTAGALVHGAAALAKLSGDGEPLVWAKRLAHRYVETRDPKTGIGAGIYTGEQTEMPALQEMKDLDLNVLGIDSFFPTPPTFGNSDMRRCWYGYCTVSPGIPFNGLVSPWICALLVGEMMGSEGKEFIKWSLEELSAWGRVAYRKSDNSWIPMLRDGTSLEGLVVKKDGSFGPEGTIVVPISVIPMDFWAYALAYRLTENDFMWQMARSIALGSGLGDIGVTSGDLTELKRNIDCADPYALLGFLELYRKTQREPFLGCAKQIGDNILKSRFHKGFFAPSSRHFYARFDSPESLALLHLYAVSMSRHAEVPTMWPSQAFFEHAYRDKEAWDDNSLIYRLTESPEPPISLQEAAAMGDLNLIKSLIEEGVEIDSREDSFFKTALHRAAISGHKDVTEFLLTNSADINARDGSTTSALHYATENGHKEIVELLIAKGADVNAARGYPAGDTPLHSAARAGHKDIIELLIAKGADVNAKNNNGQTPLDIAITNNRKDIIELLLAKGADTSIHVAAQIGDLARVGKFVEGGANVNAKNNQGMTALHLAVQEKHQDVAKFLITKGADINGKDKSGYTPLYYAIWNEDKDMVRLLVAKGADVNLKPEKGYPPLHNAVWMEDIDVVKLLVANGASFDVKDQVGWTAFRYAASQGSRDIVELFISRGADTTSFHLAACAGDLARVKHFVQQGTDVDVKDKHGWTPLYWAACTGRTDVVQFLVTKGANVSAKTNDNQTPLHQAAQAGEAKLVELLILKGADVNAKTKNGNTSLHSAASAGHRAVVDLLIVKGANVDAKSKYGQTPLYSAALRGRRDVVELLVAKGADIDAKARSDQTALHLAAIMGRKDMAALLIAKGADINSKDVNGQTPLHLSARQGRRDTVELLINKGGDINAKNKWGRTPLEIASDRGHNEIVSLLRKHGSGSAVE